MITVDVYWNLHRKCFSIRSMGLVVGHARSFVLSDARFKVSAKGRDRVRQTRRKEVHAVVRGTLVHWVGIGDDYEALTLDPDAGPVTYNPYTHDTFQIRGEPVSAAALVAGETMGGRPSMRALS
jgi:hypothetical protein